MNILQATEESLRILFSKAWIRKKVVFYQVLKQILFTGVEALPLIIYSSILVGFIVIAQSLIFLPQYGVGEYISNIMVVILTEIGPLIVMFIIIGRSGNAISVEVATMKLNGEIDFLENSLLIDTKLFLMFPRFLGVTISTISLSIIFSTLTIFSGYMSSLFFIYFPFASFTNSVLNATALEDIIFWILKVTVFGFVISLVAYTKGYNVKPTYRDAPRVASRSFIQSMSICFVLDALISGMAIAIK